MLTSLGLSGPGEGQRSPAEKVESRRVHERGGRSELHCFRNGLLGSKYVCLSDQKSGVLFSKKSITQAKTLKNIQIMPPSSFPPWGTDSWPSPCVSGGGKGSLARSGIRSRGPWNSVPGNHTTQALVMGLLMGELLDRTRT